MDLVGSKILGLPELLINVLRHADSPRTLAHCAAVNHQWYHIAIPMLWEGSSERDLKWVIPSAYHLCKLARLDPARLRDLIQYVRYLTLEMGFHPVDDGELLSLWSPQVWSAARPRSVSVDLTTESTPEEGILQLLNPDLRHLALFTGAYSDNFIRSLSIKAPNLTWLLLDNKGDPMSPAVLDSYLQSQQCLRGLELIHGFEPTLTENTLWILSNMPTLEHLALDHESKAISTHVLNHSKHLFSSLKSLDVPFMPAKCLDRISAAAINLRKVDLSEIDNTGTSGSLFFKALSRCQWLEEVALFVSGIMISEQDLRCFANGCRRLRTLEVASGIFLDTSTTIQALSGAVESWPLMERLEWRLDCSGDCVQFLDALAQNCPRLLDLEIQVGLNLSDLRYLSTSHKLTSLESLCCNAIRIDQSSSNRGDTVLEHYHDFDALLTSRMPRLKVISEYGNRPPPQEVAALLKKLNARNGPYSAHVEPRVVAELERRALLAS